MSGKTITPGREMAQFSEKLIMGAPFETTDRYAFFKTTRLKRHF